MELECTERRILVLFLDQWGSNYNWVLPYTSADLGLCLDGQLFRGQNYA